MSEREDLRVVVLGGGTAGWMTACLLVKSWPDATITVVESPEIGVIGVGEGSTPQLRALFEALGIDEAEWMPRAHATYKTGIAFHDWSDRPGFDRYFHSFAGATDLHTQPAFHYNTLARRTGLDVPAHPDRFFLNARLAERRLPPLAPERFPLEVGYGYHFDAHEVGEVLRDHAVGRGVRHLSRRVDRVVVAEDGNVAHLLLEGDERLDGDLFVDASGFRSAVAQEALGVRFLPFADNLFNDRAVTIATPPRRLSPVHTTATALSAGWAWDIPLTSRTGNGYVYSSAYLSAHDAETELRAQLGLLDSETPARHLAMKVGRVERSWVGNCLAVGLAQGFIEPLEATALHLVQATVEGFIAAYAEGGSTAKRRDAFNANIARRYEGVRDYIVCHYRMNARPGDYWRNAREHDRLSDDLKAIVTAWFTGGDVAAEVERRSLSDYYAPMSWEVLLAGYGTFPDAARLAPAPDRVDLPAVDRFLDRCLLNFTSPA